MSLINSGIVSQPASTNSELWPSRSAWALAVLILCIYAVFPTHTYHWDGVLFSLGIESAYARELPVSLLVHPNHLLYSVFGYVLYSLSRALGLSLSALAVLQAANIVAGSIACLIFSVLATRVLYSKSAALVASLVFAFGALWWKYSTDADSYILTTLFLLLASLMMLVAPGKWFYAAACHVFAMMFHELAVFFYLPMFLLLFYPATFATRNIRLLRCFAYLALTGCAIGLVYFVCWSRISRSIPLSFLAWIGSYAHDSRFAQSFLEIIGPNILSYSKLFGGGKPAFIVEYFSFPVLLAVLILIGSLIAALLFLRRPVRPRLMPSDRQVSLLLWGWLLSIASFLAIFEPGNPIHKVLVWPPVVLLAARFILSNRSLGKYAGTFAALGAALAAWNFAAFAYPHSHDSADPVLLLAKTLDRELPPNAIVYYSAFSPDDWYLAYFARGHAFLPLPPQQTISQLLAHTRNPVCFETTALDSLKQKFGGNQLDPLKRWQVEDIHHHVNVQCALR